MSGFDDPAEHNAAPASAARARWLDANGITGQNRRIVLSAIADSGEYGQAEREGERVTNLSHQSYSGARSWLHEHGHVARLADSRREHGSVYVTPGNLNGRRTYPFKPNARRVIQADAPVPSPDPEATAAPTIPPDVAEAAERIVRWADGQRRSGLIVVAPDWDDIDAITNHLTKGTQ